MTRITVFLLAASLLAPGWGHAAPSPDPAADPPALRVETGRHSAPINRLGLDPAERWFATTSYDKTVRLWSLDGRPLRTLRLPIGPEDEGSLYGIAVTPDGRTLATGGWTSAGAGSDEWVVYLLDLAAPDDGKLRRIAGLPKRSTFLAFSPDGTHLALALQGGKGVRVYRTADLSLAWSDESYGVSDCLWVAFAPDGRLLTASRVPDSKVRLYGTDFAKLGEFSPPSGKDAVSAVFAPDGAQIAVGYAYATAIDVLDGRTLAHRFSPDARGATGGFNRVAWSLDGQFLYAAGTQRRGERFPIFRWSDGGRGAYRTVAAGREWVAHLAPTRDGGLLYATAEPAVGALDAEFRPRFDLAPVGADYREMGDTFLLSPDGREVYLSLEAGGRKPARFSLTERTLELDPPAPGGDVDRPAEKAGLTNWKKSKQPKLGDKVLALQRYEEALSHAALADGVLIGGEWYLYRFDDKGERVWRTSAPGPIHAVAPSKDGKRIVAAMGDGTVRWYRLEDGAELLAAFLQADGRRWVSWTPEGFFDHAPGGGEELVGWHLDRGRERLGEFVGIGQLYQRFYRPDLVAKKLAGTAEGEIKAALVRAGEVRESLAGSLPPTPLIVNAWPEGKRLDRRDVELEVRLRDTGGGFGRVVFRVNGVAIGEIDASRDYNNLIATAPGKFDRLVIRPLTLEPGDNRIEVAAYDGANAVESKRATRTVRVEDGLSAAPALFMLTVGIDRYRASALRLRYAVADATAFAGELERRAKPLFRAIKVVPLTDGDATIDGIAKAFAQLAGEVKSHDVFVLYMAGHGVTLEGRYHFLPADIVPSNLDDIRATALPQDKLESMLATVAALKSVILLDTCHAGAFATPGARGLQEIAAMDRLKRATGRAILAAASAEQQALEGHEGHGVFTYALLAGLKGAAPAHGRDGVITVNDLAQFVGDEVRRITRLRFGIEQVPIQNLQGASFPIAVGR